MKIVDIPGYKDKKDLLLLDKELSVLEAVTQMKKMNYGAVMVVDSANEDKLCGMFTERDLLMKVVAEGKDVSSIKLKDVMTKKVQTAQADDTVYNSMRRMTTGRFRHLPIVDEKGKIIGLVSQGDFVAISWYQLYQQVKEKGKLSFTTYTQFWVFFIGFMAYTAIMITLLKY